MVDLVNVPRRRVCVFTGSRADYGPLLPLLRAIDADPELDLRLLVSGGHLVADQGFTVRTIADDGFVVDECVENVVAGESCRAVSKSFGLACMGYADALDRIRPDVLLVAGDRYEALAATIVGVQRRTVVAHIGGGQLSQGSADDGYRHAISKLAHVHFAVTERDRARIIGMGENPGRVATVGMVGLSRSTLEQLPGRETLESELEFRIRTPTFVVTHHPATADPGGSKRSLEGLLEALDEFPRARLFFTAPNVDEGGTVIADRLREYVRLNQSRAAFAASLGQRRYLALVRHADVVVGNSSSGINEAPLLGTPTVNIGRRQDGRHKASSVVDCGESSAEIVDAIRKALAMTAMTATTALPAKSDHDAPTPGDLGLITKWLREMNLKEMTRKYFFESTC
ncbi:UDP-N-acetylglucosamine 2-epimerase [Saccharomonospora sp. NPDC006951]